MTKHLKDIGESYLTHLKHALWIWFHLLLAVLVLPIHALLPDVFTHTAGNILDKIEVYRANREAKEEYQSE